MYSTQILAVSAKYMQLILKTKYRYTYTQMCMKSIDAKLWRNNQRKEKLFPFTHPSSSPIFHILPNILRFNSSPHQGFFAKHPEMLPM